MLSTHYIILRFTQLKPLTNITYTYIGNFIVQCHLMTIKWQLYGYLNAVNRVLLL